MSKYILPVFIVGVIIVGFLKKVPVYDSFVSGVRQSMDLLISILPYFCTILIAVELFSLSGLNKYLEKLLEPVFTALGIPSQLCELLIIRPLSGNGSIALLQSLYLEHGADSYIARCASVIVGASDTTFYIATVYFSTVKAHKLRYAIPVSLIASYIGAVVACVVCRYI